MKKLLMLAIVAGIVNMVQAQDFKAVQKAELLKQTETAKTEIDKVMADQKAQAKAEGWMWKAHIYAAIYKDDKLREKYPNADVTADEAFQKYAQMDPSFKVMKDNNTQDAAFDLYSTSFKLGVGEFNKKDWAKSLYFFKYSVTYSDIIFQNKWNDPKSNIAFDTTSILYAGYSAQNAQKTDEALKYYTRLADNKIKGEGFADVYKFILIAYSNEKKLDSFNKYLTLAKEVYPKENWDEYEVDYVNRNYTLAQKAELYDKEDASGKLTALKYLHFGDGFANLSQEDKAKLDSTQIMFYQHKAADAFKKASNLNAADGLAPFNVGVIAYNEFGLYDDRMRDNVRKMQDLNSNKPVEKDPKKKVAVDAELKQKVDAIRKLNAEMEAPAVQAADDAINWLEKSYNTLKDKTDRTNIEKNCLSKSVDFLSNLYGYKRDKVRGKDPKKYDEYDAKYKLYDGLHGKF